MFLATQMWTLAQLLPLMVGDHVPIGDDHWENFLLMLKVNSHTYLSHTQEYKVGRLHTVYDFDLV